MEPVSIALVAAAVLIGIATVAWATLKGWSGWLEVKRLELCRDGGDRSVPPASGRIEIADLKERVRKLEAIAAGIDI